MMKTLRFGKAAGPDGMTAELLKHGGEPAAQMTVRLIQTIWRTQQVPVDMAAALIYLIPKDRRRIKNPELQRPISLINIWLKLLDKLLQTRLQRHNEENSVIADV
jgi:hypothetical protein